MWGREFQHLHVPPRLVMVADLEKAFDQVPWRSCGERCRSMGYQARCYELFGPCMNTVRALFALFSVFSAFFLVGVGRLLSLSDHVSDFHGQDLGMQSRPGACRTWGALKIASRLCADVGGGGKHI